MATTSIVRLSDKDVERLAAAMADKTGTQLTEIAKRLTAIEGLLAEKKPSKKTTAAQ